MGQTEVPSRYVMLIGINVYREHDTPLKGSVRDVQEIKAYLESTMSPVDIRIFTASPAEKGCSSLLAEDSGLWPTYDNVVANLKQIESSAKPNDLLYIHFSGHGTMHPTGDLALPLLEVDEKIQLHYLRGWELAHIIKGMAKKDLHVTLVLDCCYSGSVARKDFSVRNLDYDPDVDAAYPPDPSLSLSLGDGPIPPAHRKASMRSNWLVNPDQYIILTACGPTEKAREITLNGQNHGLLSYALLRTFKKLGGAEGKYQHIYYHLCTKFKEYQEKRKEKQNPMFYGKKSVCFLGRDDLEDHTIPIPVTKKRDGSMQLEAGQAHGVCDGDIFAISSIKLETIPRTTDPISIIATVTHAQALTADMRTIETPIPYFETGWLATPVTCLSLRQFPIRLELSPPFPSGWTVALQERKSLNIHTMDSAMNESSFSFHVAKKSDLEYEIRDEISQQIVPVPVMITDQEEAVRYVLDVVTHLTRFKLVKNLANPAMADPQHPFRNSFKVQLIDRAGRRHLPGCLREGWLHNGCLHPECVVEIRDGDWLEMVVEDTRVGGDCVLYVHVYNMDSYWEIANILEGNHAAVSNRRGEWNERIEMTIPDEIKTSGQFQSEDIIKVFVTGRPTSFASLELPELATLASRDKSSGPRVKDGEMFSDEWAAFNFRIRILAREKLITRFPG